MGRLIWPPAHTLTEEVMTHLTDKQYGEVRVAYKEIYESHYGPEVPHAAFKRVPPCDDTIEATICLFYDPADYWQWHPDSFLVEAIEDVIGCGISELTDNAEDGDAVDCSAGANIIALLVVAMMFFGPLA